MDVLLLYESSVESFVTAARASEYKDHLAERFYRLQGHHPGRGEIASWGHSLKAMADRCEEAGIGSAHVMVEYKLPLTEKRLDCMFLGSDGKDRDNTTIVELKQWTDAELSPLDGCIKIYGEVHLHPSAQVGDYTQYLSNTLEVFQNGGIDITGCVYMHNLQSLSGSTFGDPFYRGYTAQFPIFDRGREAALVDMLSSRFARGGGENLFRRVIDSKYRPSPRLLDHVAEMIKGNPVYTLLDEQKVAYEAVRAAVMGRLGDGKRAVIIEGGPGTGKSVIAMRLLADLASQTGRGGDRLKVNHATGSKAFTTNVRAVVGRGGEPLFRYFNSYATAGSDSLDVLICDEAHRIRRSSADRYHPRRTGPDRGQVDELLSVARVSAFFLDDHQVVRPGEIGTPDLIRRRADALGIPHQTIRLASQFRCVGSSAYIEWIEWLLGLRDVENRGWIEANEFEFRVFDSPACMEEELAVRASEGSRVRLVAGFCWPWSDPPSAGPLVADVVIGDWRRAWNRKEKGNPPSSHHAYTEWANTDRLWREQVGCIYSAQGMEWDYVGVILGPDLVRRNGKWVAQPKMSEDKTVRRSSQLARLLANTYRVLLTRGMRGCYVTVLDPETLDWVRTALKGAP